MAEKQDGSDHHQEGRLPTQLSQTTEEIARAAVAAAAAVRPPPSIVVSSNKHHQHQHQGAASFHKWRRHLQKAMHWGSHDKRERERNKLFNPEVLTRQKRQWSELQLQALERKNQKQVRPAFFDHFVVVGLHPNTNVEATEVAFAKKKAWQRDPERAQWLGTDTSKSRGPAPPTLEPQVLFKYPPAKRLPLKTKDLPAFCFPSGVEARLMERTPSMSDLNEIMYGQSHQNRDDQSFIFLLKVADNVTLYGVCVLVREIVQRLPGILAMNNSVSPPRSPHGRFLVSAPRCYCFLTRLPFFNLHIEVLNSIIAQERLDRITQCVNEMALVPHSIQPMAKVVSKKDDEVSPSAHSEDDPDRWMDSAIPVNSVLGATAAAAGLISDKELLSFSSKGSGPPSPDGLSSDGLSPAPHRHADGDGDQGGYHEGNGVRAPGGNFSPSPSPSPSPRSVEQQRGDSPHVGKVNQLQTLMEVSRSAENGDHDERSSNGNLTSCAERPPRPPRGHERVESSDSVYSNFESSIRSNDSDDDVYEDEASTPVDEDSYGSRAVLAWAEANNNDSLRIVCSYHRTPVPGRGSSIVFQPLEHLQPINFMRRKDIPILPVARDHGRRSSLEVAEIQREVMAGEEAIAISMWATVTICRAMSLENVLIFFAGALLERQMVVICPNLGVLSAVVMAVIPMIRPYEWQSLLLPILPEKMLDFLEAPVPFIMGVQRKTSDVRARSANLIRVNVYKNKVTVPSYMPQLPRQKELMATLEPHYLRITAESNVSKRHPVFEYSESQAQGANGFLAVLRNYLESLCMDLRTHTITNVQSNDDKVSLLLKESLVDSFVHRDRAFMKLFAETQQFSVYTDAVLSSY